MSGVQILPGPFKVDWLKKKLLELYSLKKEEGIRNFWKRKKIVGKVREQAKRKKKNYYFIDGPPYASGHIHMGTALNKVLKDISIRMKRMQGYNVRDQPGYDTHGVPIEHKVEKKLGIKNKQEIEQYGIDRFVNDCKKFATEFIDTMNSEFDNLGVWMDWDNPYLTLENYYIEAIWWTFKRADEKGLLYLGSYPVHVCPRCVDLNSKVLIEGCVKNIGDLKNSWQNEKPVCFNLNSKKLETGRFGSFIEHKNEDVYLLKTLSDSSIIATPDHPFLVKGLEWKDLKDLEIGDRVAVCHHPEVQEDRISKIVLSDDQIDDAIELIEARFSNLKSLGTPNVTFQKLTSRGKQKIKNEIERLRKKHKSYKKIKDIIYEKYKVRVSKSLISKLKKFNTEDRSYFVKKWLKENGFLPLNLNNRNMPILTRILGHLFGDGSTLIKDRSGYFPDITLFFSGKEEDLKLIQSDLNKLNLKYGKIDSKISKSVVNNRKIVGKSTSFRISNLPFSVLMLALDGVYGRKSEKTYGLPKWIERAPKYLKRDFLAGYFGSELTKLRTSKHKGFEELRFVMNKSKKHEKNAEDFINSIYKLLRGFHIKTKKPIKRYLEVNGRDVVSLIGRISSEDENIIKFCKKISYEYSKDRKEKARLACSYLKFKKQEIEKEKRIIDKILNLKEKGYKPQQIRKKLNMGVKKIRYIYYYKEKIKKGIRISKRIPKFEDYVKQNATNLKDGLVWETITKKKYLGKRDVADVSVPEFHNFIVNGFVSHNCETAVAYNEIEYVKQTDTSAYVKFPVKGETNKFLIIWTTTPWTLPGNTGVMVHPKYDYAEVQLSNGEIWIIANKLVQGIMDTIEAGFTIKRIFKGKEMEGMLYENPLTKHLRLPKMDDAYRVILSERYVNLEEGTGLVHTAPGHGKEDYNAGIEAKLPAVSPVEMNGIMNVEAGKYAGKKAREVDGEIINDLEEADALVYKHPYTHDYPVCWRCNTPLLMLSTPQWFFRISKIQERLIELNKKVQWVPSWGQDRFHNWLESLSDWPVSRARYWGTPLPIWICKKCNERIVISSLDELRKYTKVSKNISLHRPWIDAVRIKCSCSGTMERVPEVLDVWFDSGVCSWGSLNYPKDKKLFEQFWPPDINIEGSDQIRGWWNSQLITSAICFDEEPYKTIVMHGLVLDISKRKMSKSEGNIVTPEEVITKYNRDYLRFYLASETVGEDLIFDWKVFKEINRFFNIYWNVYNFTSMYLELRLKSKAKPKLEVEDKWLVSKLNSLIKEVTEEYNNYNFSKVIQLINYFVLEELSRTYIKLVRERIGTKSEAAITVSLNSAIFSLLRLLAPITPHISEYIYQDLKESGMAESIHMLELPAIEKRLIDKGLEQEMQKAKELSQQVLSLREEKRLRLRWILKEVVIKSKTGKELGRVRGVLARMCNVKKVLESKAKPKGDYAEKVAGEFTIYLSLDTDEKLKEEWELAELRRRIQDARKQAKLIPSKKIGLFIYCSDPDFLKRYKKGIEESTNTKIIEKKGKTEKLLNKEFYIKLKI